MSTTPFKIFKETGLPGTLVANATYFVAPATVAPGADPLVEIYVTDSAGAARRVINKADITSMINAAVALVPSGAPELTIVADIAARNALLPLTVAKYVFVKAAGGVGGDATVGSGGATYLYDPSASGTAAEWIKTSEAESMDVTAISWSALTGGPTSTAAAIDAAVSASHTHTNLTQLNKISESGGGDLLYNGALPATGWTSTSW
jgi:hypothetical protein